MSRSKQLAGKLAALEQLSLAQLRLQWEECCDGPVPNLSTGLLRLALAWQLQARTYGGLSLAVQRALQRPSSFAPQHKGLVPGTRLVREYSGTMHVVTISDSGAICWNEREYRSLSEVARAITGTRWSGPAFFGLKGKDKTRDSARTSRGPCDEGSASHKAGCEETGNEEVGNEEVGGQKGSSRHSRELIAAG